MDMMLPKAIRFESASGSTQAVIAPDWGANVLGFSFRSSEWQWPVPVLEAADLSAVALQPTSYGIPVLSPSPGRTGRNQSGEMEFQGRRYKLRQARHGVLRHAQWSAEQTGEDRIVCSVQIRPPSRSDRHTQDFPFCFDAVYEIAVGAATLDLSLHLTNSGETDQPLDAGWHPYFARDAESSVVIPASTRWELFPDKDPTPTGRLRPLPDGISFPAGHRIPPDELWDDVLELDKHGAEDSAWCTSWIESGREVLLKSGRVERLTLRRWIRTRTRSEPGRSAPMTHMQLYTPIGRQALCLEPLSAIPNAINLSGADAGTPIGFNTVSPGASIRYHISLGLSHPA